MSNHVVKLNDAEGEAAETMTWLDFAQSCGSLPDDEHERPQKKYRKIRKGLIKMMENPDPWCGPSALHAPPDYVTDKNNEPSCKH